MTNAPFSGNDGQIASLRVALHTAWGMELAPTNVVLSALSRQ